MRFKSGCLAEIIYTVRARRSGPVIVNRSRTTERTERGAPLNMSLSPNILSRVALSRLARLKRNQKREMSTTIYRIVLATSSLCEPAVLRNLCNRILYKLCTLLCNQYVLKQNI